MLLINHELKRIYLGFGKTGTSTVLYALTGAKKNDQKNKINGWIYNPSPQWDDFLNNDYTDYDMYFLLREPMNRFVSGIYEIISPQHDPDDKLEDILDINITSVDFLNEIALNNHTCNYLWSIVLYSKLCNLKLLYTREISNHFKSLYGFDPGKHYQSTPEFLVKVQEWLLKNYNIETDKHLIMEHFWYDVCQAYQQLDNHNAYILPNDVFNNEDLIEKLMHSLDTNTSIGRDCTKFLLRKLLLNPLVSKVDS